MATVNCSSSELAPAATPSTATERKYLLERIDDAAVVQISGPQDRTAQMLE